MSIDKKNYWIIFLVLCSTLSAGLTLAADTPDVAALRQYDIRVDGMSCPFCVATSKKALKKITGVQTVAADLERGEVYVCADDRVAFTDTDLKELFLSKGFTYRSFSTADTCTVSE